MFWLISFYEVRIIKQLLLNHKTGHAILPHTLDIVKVEHFMIVTECQEFNDLVWTETSYFYTRCSI